MHIVPSTKIVDEKTYRSVSTSHKRMPLKYSVLEFEYVLISLIFSVSREKYPFFTPYFQSYTTISTVFSRYPG